MIDLAGRHFLVVGGGTRRSDDSGLLGNGRAIAIAIAAAGGSVSVSDIDESAADHTVAMIISNGGSANAIVANAAKSDECEMVVTTAHGVHGYLDGVVCNVGIGLGHGVQGTSTDEWDLVFDVNVRSHFVTMRTALPLMNENSSSVLISSVAGLKPGSGLPAYDASKAAQIALMKQSAREAALTGGRVNVVAPGLIDTPLGRVATSGRPSRQTTRVPLGRQGTAREVAAATVFLLSSAASYITGQVLAVDGGLSTLM